ncbi:hypothetical protein ASG85_12975 [Paenibacillus sp. Soil724D2]|nr:hypothetical protein ASG85_12975 [Paenibacillus sp. Soil724D2]
MTGFANIGQFISPLITNGIQTLFSLGSIRSVFLIITILISVIFLASVTQGISEKKRELVKN